MPDEQPGLWNLVRPAGRLEPGSQLADGWADGLRDRVLQRKLKRQWRGSEGTIPSLVFDWALFPLSGRLHEPGKKQGKLFLRVKRGKGPHSRCQPAVGQSP